MKIFYHHIPRTGGTSIAKIAEKNYGKNFFIWTHNINVNDVLTQIKNKKKFFILHDSLASKNDVEQILSLCDFDFISVRNPISRFESMYNIWIDSNENISPYNISSKKLSIDEFYYECKKQDKKLFLNIQHEYLNLYHPQKIIKTENFSTSLYDLKDIGIFNDLCDEDLNPSNKSNNKSKLFAETIKDYKNNFLEDFQMCDYG